MLRRRGTAAAFALAVVLAVGPLRAEDPALAPHETSGTLLDGRTLLITAGVLVATPLVGYFSFWQGEGSGHFHVTHEGWFGEETYAGGADKASHITVSYFGALALQSAYRKLGKSPAEARALAFGTTVLAGLVIELGDGFTTFGFSWEDAAANALGAGIATALDRYDLKDAIGLRYGTIPGDIPPPCCRYGGSGRDYSRQIFTADLKLEGFLPRVGVRPGPARFLLVSGTYSSKGYRFSPPENRRREVGIEVGLNLAEIFRAVGVRDDTWWGKPILVFFTYFRVPYTAVGWRYDLNSHTWSGPNNGETYDPGRILYD